MLSRYYAFRNQKGINMAEFKYEIIRTLGILSETPKEWTVELNLISYYESEPKYDLLKK